MQEYTKTDQHLHQLCQTLAKFGRSFAEAKKDDSHTNLRFDFIGKKIWGRWGNFNNDPLILSLNLNNQMFDLIDKKHQVVTSFETIGKTQGEVEVAIAHYLRETLKTDSADFLKELHFEIPGYDFKNDPIRQWDAQALNQWINYRHLANQSCSLLVDHLNVEAEIRIWPHHFDTGIYAKVNDNIGIGFGWAMEDSMIAEAYYYLSVYALNGNTIDYDSVKPLSAGKWITGKHWNGSVLSISDAKPPMIQSFLKETTAWALS